MTLIRYPGSKAKLTDEILSRMPYSLWRGLFSAGGEYREPFFGGGAVGFKVMAKMSRSSRVWINDKDLWLSRLWESVRKRPRQLCKLIKDFKPNTSDFYKFKEQDGCPKVDHTLAGFRKLACHQMSMSGFGVMSGGPLGGREQTNREYPIGCRWNPDRLRTKVIRLHRLMREFDEVVITHDDFAVVLGGATESSVIYVDPPYVKAGPQLYKHSLSTDDHRRLARLLKPLKCQWFLSYDDHELVRELYADCRIESVQITYTNATHATGRRPKNSEVVIQPKAAS